jgi:type IV secretion system protein VirD4
MRYNPFSGLKDRDDAHKLVNILIPDSKMGLDPYWVDSSRELAETLIDLLMQSEGEVTFERLMNLLYKTGTGRKIEGGIEVPADDDVDSYIEKLKFLGKNCAGMERYKSLKNNAADTWLCVRASCIAALSAFDSDKLFSVTDKTTVDFAEMATEKVAIFVTSSDMNGVFAPVIQLMYRDIVQKLIELADNKYIECRSMLPHHVRFILDDFASGTVMDDFEKVIANCRSRNISFMLSIQSLSQLSGLYKDRAESIMDCINYRVYFSSTNLKTQQYISTITDKPLSEIQKLGREDICIEKINCIPKFGKRFPTDTLFTAKRMNRR